MHITSSTTGRGHVGTGSAGTLPGPSPCLGCGSDRSRRARIGWKHAEVDRRARGRERGHLGHQSGEGARTTGSTITDAGAHREKRGTKQHQKTPPRPPAPTSVSVGEPSAGEAAPSRGAGGPAARSSAAAPPHPPQPHDRGNLGGRGCSGQPGRHPRPPRAAGAGKLPLPMAA